MGEPRPEYAALAAEFARLAAPFGDRVDERLRRDISRLATAIERIDRLVDEATDDDERRARWRSVIARLDGDRDTTMPPELREGADDLCAIGQERNVLRRLRRIVAKEATTSEAMRRAPSSGAFVPLVLREGRLTAALALIVAGPDLSRRFRRFFFRLGGPANLVDKIKDAKEDHARGEIQIAPSLPLYLRLSLSLVTRSISLMTSHPRPLSIISLGLRYLRSTP